MPHRFPKPLKPFALIRLGLAQQTRPWPKGCNVPPCCPTVGVTELHFETPDVRILSMTMNSATGRPEPLKPILTAHLFPKVDGLLLELLRSLSPEDWEKQTVSGRWRVRDVAAHLLDT